MKRLIISLLLVPAFLFSTIPVAVGDDSTVAQMAQITFNLNHYPTETEKKDLLMIIKNNKSTEGERLLAKALEGMKHSVGGADAKKLRELITDDSSSSQEQELAKIVLGLSHKPSSSDKKRLKELID